MKTDILQQDDNHSPAFVLQTAPTAQVARETAYLLAKRRDAKGREFPKLKVLGVSY
jgi:hypothetical protein